MTGSGPQDWPAPFRLQPASSFPPSSFTCSSRSVWQHVAAGITVACYALNPNVLYLGSIPMTEVVFFAAFSTMLFALLRFRRTENQWLVILAAFASIAASLTRYDGWFLIPFFTAGFFLCARGRRYRTATLFLALASLAPLYWFAHNCWETSDFLSFYRGPYSAKAIYRRALDAGLPRYRGDHEWGYAAGYYGAAGFVCAGWSLVTLGIIGLFFAIRKRRFLPVAFLGLTPAFYIWSMYSSGTPIFLPFLHSQGYYNTRYGIAVLPLAAFAAGAIVLAIPSRWQRAALAIPLLAVLPWIVQFFPRALDLLEGVAGKLTLTPVLVEECSRVLHEKLPFRRRFLTEIR